jgi:hypothetical protein
VTIAEKETDAMSEPWERIHRRQRVLTAVLAEVARSGRPVISRPDEVTAEFGDVDGFLLALHARWATAVHAHLDAVLEDPPDDVPTAVAQLWRALATRHAPLRALLDASSTRPAVRAADERLRRSLLRDLGVDLPAPTALPDVA